jgi:predicted amidohydrolase
MKKIMIAQISPKLGELNKNFIKHIEIVDMAVEEKCDLVVFPELSLTGYCLRDLVYEVAINEKHEIIKKLLDKSNKISIVFGCAYLDEHDLVFNAALYLDKGKITYLHKKVYLPDYTMFEEGRYFARGSYLDVFKSTIGNVGLLICEDGLHISSAYALFKKGVSTIIIISNSPARGVYKEQFYAKSMWETVTKFISMSLTSFVIFVNRAGVEEGITFWGGSHVFDPFGNKVISLPLISEDYKAVEIELDDIYRARIVSPFYKENYIMLGE